MEPSITGNGLTELNFPMILKNYTCKFTYTHIQITEKAKNIIKKEFFLYSLNYIEKCGFKNQSCLTAGSSDSSTLVQRKLRKKI